MKQLALALCSTVVAGGLAFVAWQWLKPSTPYQSIRIDPDVEPEQVAEGREPYVVDPVVGFRAPRSATFKIKMMALDATELETVERRSNNLGFVREDDLVGELPGPRVLVVGDSHTLGVVDTDDNLGPVLERDLREHDGLGDALVLNAGCGYYSLYQYVLRARTLVEPIRPDVVVVVVFAGNDFLDLENQRYPHLDDALIERPPAESPPPQTTSARQEWLQLPQDDAVKFYMDSAFWQGLNQAAYLHRHPDRRDSIRSKASRCVELMDELSEHHDFEVVWALLPSVDLIFPQHLRTASEVAGTVVDSGVQREMFEWFAHELERKEAKFVDLRPAFERDGRLSLYAVDFHIWREGHRLVAEGVAPLVRDALQR